MLKCYPILFAAFASCANMPSAGTEVDTSENTAQDAQLAELHAAVADTKADVPPQNLRQPLAQNTPICAKDQDFNFSTPKLHFGKVAAGKHAALSVTIVYAGDCALPIKFKLLGSDHFSIKLLGQTLQAGGGQDAYLLPTQAIEFYVQFPPNDDSLQAGLLHVVSGNSTQELAIDGNPPPDLIPSVCAKVEAVLAFSVPVGVPEVLTAQIYNCGDTIVSVESVAFTGPTNPQFTLDFSMMATKCPNINGQTGPAPDHLCKLLPGGATKFEVIFKPTQQSALDANGAAIPQTALVQVATSDGKKHLVTLQAVAGPPGCPKAVVTVNEGEEVIPQTLLHLVGAKSKAAGAAIKKYKWTVKQPAGTYQKLVPGDTFPNPAFLANVSGIYTFCLDVWDENDVKSCNTTCVAVVVVPNNNIHIELLWDTPAEPVDDGFSAGLGADLDLHFAHPLAGVQDLDCDGNGDPWFNNPFDCFWFNPQPKWGSSMSFDDDPSLDLDSTDRPGPESLNLKEPEDNANYSVGVHYWNDHGYGVSTAKLAIYFQGILISQLKQEMNPLDMWYVGKIHWPEATIENCYQSGDACTAKEAPTNPKGGKMWQKSGANCLTPCYFNPVMMTDFGGAPPKCKKKVGP